MIARRSNSPILRPIDTSTLGPIRIDVGGAHRRRQRALETLRRHCPDIENRRGELVSWAIDAMLAFADGERR